MSSNSQHVIVVGAGVIGCSIAYHLSLAGNKVTLIDRNRIASGSSGVAAGMIASVSEGFSDDLGFKKDVGNLFDLADSSRSQLLGILDKLENESGIDIEYRESGIMHLAITQSEVDELQNRLQWQCKLGMGVDWLDSQATLKAEPSLNNNIMGSLLSPNEGHVNSRRLVNAFAKAAIKNGTDLLENTDVTGLLSSNGRITGVKLQNRIIESDWVVFAAGSWAGRLSDWIGLDIPIKPIKGQVLACRPVPCHVSHILWRGINWMVPKADGSIIMGTTREDVGFDDLPNIGSIAGILNECIKLVPDIFEAKLHKVWAGLRPATPDELPIIGPVEKCDGLVLALGHYRSGMLLSTVSGKLVSDYISSGVNEDLEELNLSRFH